MWLQLVHVPPQPSDSPQTLPEQSGVQVDCVGHIAVPAVVEEVSPQVAVLEMKSIPQIPPDDAQSSVVITSPEQRSTFLPSQQPAA